MTGPRWKQPVRDCHAAARDEAERYGARLTDLEPGAKHAHAWLEWGGCRHKMTFACSPRAGFDTMMDRARQNVRNALRRFVA